MVTILVIAGLDYNTTKQVKSLVSDDDGSTNPVDLSSAKCEYCTHEETEHALKNMQKREAEIEETAKKHGPISWSLFNSDPSKYAGREVHLYNSDFESGTLRLKAGGMFVLKEDILFNPNRFDDHMPTPAQTEYADPAYRVGFFAAITVEADDVLIDLDEFSIGQSVEHALQQRIFFCIELNDQPFLSTEGPIDFGTSVVFVKNVIVRNGVLGPSSHHGIHGNGGRKIYIHDVDVIDKEVAGLAFNGFTDVVIERVVVHGMRPIPVRGTYAQSRGLRQFVNIALALSAGAHPVEEANLQAALIILEDLMFDVYEDIVTNELEGIDCGAHPDACDLFDNPSRLPDGGSVYGILFNSLGVAVLGFGEGTVQADGNVKFGADIYMLDCEFDEQIGHPVEVISLMNMTNGAIQHGPSGGVVNILEAASGVNGDYSGTPLTDVQILLAKLVKLLPTSYQHIFARMSIDDGVIAWFDGLRSLYDMVATGDYRYMRNGDAQAHVLKGMFGVRIERTHSVCMRGIRISDIVNLAERCITEALYGETESDFCPQATGTGHPAQGHYTCCQRGDARGLLMAQVTGGRLRDVTVHNVTSSHSWARGMDFFDRSKRMSVIDTDISQISTAPGCDYKELCCSERWNSPKTPQAVGLAFELVDVGDVCRENVNIKDIENGCVVGAFQSAGGEI